MQGEDELTARHRHSHLPAAVNEEDTRAFSSRSRPSPDYRPNLSSPANAGRPSGGASAPPKSLSPAARLAARIRIWQRPQVKVGCRSAASFASPACGRITLQDITPARRSGFSGVLDLLKTAKHGPGEKVYLIEFVYECSV
jgi:hypothetical protein